MLSVYFGKFNSIHLQSGIIRWYWGRTSDFSLRIPEKVINLISAGGLAIEFTGHIIQNFQKIKSPLDGDNRDQRVIETMATMGPAVVLGVTMTNLPGIITLNWAHMQIIQESIENTCTMKIVIFHCRKILWRYFNRLKDFLLSNVVSDNNNGSGTWNYISPGCTFAIRWVKEGASI